MRTGRKARLDRPQTGRGVGAARSVPSRPSGPARVRTPLALIVGLCLLLAACDGGKAYKKEAGGWWYGKDVVALAKGEHLTPLNAKFAKSEGHVFYRATPIDADAASFEALDEHYAKDKN